MEKDEQYMTLGQILRYVRTTKGYTLSDVVTGLKNEFTESQLSKVERDAQEASFKFIKLLTRFFDIPMEILDGRECNAYMVEQLINRHIGFESLMLTTGNNGLKTGDYGHLIKDPTETVRIANLYCRKNTFLMELESSDMESFNGGYSFLKGSILYVNPKLTAKPGDFVIAYHNKKVIFKQFDVIDGRTILKSLNTQYPITEMVKHSKIIGVVVGSVKSTIDMDEIANDVNPQYLS